MNVTEHLAGVAIVGGGYAGLHAARAAAAGGAPVTIFDSAGVHGFTTRLAAVAGGTAPEGDAFAPLDAFDHSVRRARVTGVGDGLLRLDDGTVIIADALVVTAGARPTAPDLPGIERVLPLRTPSDALRLRRCLDTNTAVSIVGGGATGSQLAGAAAVARPGLTVRLVDREPTLLTGLGDSLGRQTRTILEERGVTIHLESGVEQFDDDGLTLAGGRFLEGLVVWAGGFESVVSELGDDLPTDEGRLQVDENLRIAGWDRTFGAGDVAAHRRPSGELLPMAAQIAVQAGAAAGGNAARLIRGDDVEPASLTHRGWVIDLGGGRGVAEIGRVPLASAGIDRLPPLLHYAIDIKHLLEIGGLAGLRFAPGHHQPTSADIDLLLAGSRPVAGAALQP